jgi:hypothetical protein
VMVKQIVRRPFHCQCWHAYCWQFIKKLVHFLWHYHILVTHENMWITGVQIGGEVSSTEISWEKLLYFGGWWPFYSLQAFGQEPSKLLSPSRFY